MASPRYKGQIVFLVFYCTIFRFLLLNNERTENVSFLEIILNRDSENNMTILLNLGFNFVLGLGPGPISAKCLPGNTNYAVDLFS